MLKKRHQINKQILIKVDYKVFFFKKLLASSLSTNQFTLPIDRLGHFQNKISFEGIYSRFCTYQKLYCLVSFSNKVANKKFHFSRFFLNKQLNNLVISNTIK